jgi:hypothetical protein
MTDVITETPGGNCVVCGHWVEPCALGDALCGAVVRGECLAEHVASCEECQASDESANVAPAPELFLRHAGVDVYHAWHDGCVAQYWYSLDPDDADIDEDRGSQFDVRDLPVPADLAALHWDTPAGHAAVIRAAIDAGLIGATPHACPRPGPRQPTLQELAVLCYSVDTLYEWLAYRKHAEQFYGRATRLVVHINEDFDSDIGMSYSVASVDVYDGGTLLQPRLDLLNRHTDEPFTDSSDEDEIAEFLYDFVADLPVPFQFGSLHEQETVTIDLTGVPADAQLATRLLLAQGDHDAGTAPEAIPAEIYLLVTGIGGPFDTPRAFRTRQAANAALGEYAGELDLEPDESGEYDFAESEHNAALFTLDTRTLQVQ